jgi:oligopeptide/dipeptide ABC transporter ATP-binding protein
VPEPILTLKNLRKYYDPPKQFFGRKKRLPMRALDGINLTIQKRQKLGIVGESGCGKSTLAKTILRLEEPTSGEVHLLGQDITSIASAELISIRKNIQIIFQDPYSSLNPRMRIEQIIAEPLEIHTDLTAEEINERVVSLLSSVGLTADYLSRFPHELSGGQRQRVGIARALILKPKIIIADEPVSALDVSVQAQLLNLLSDLHKEYELALLLISHDISVVQHVCDTIAVMYLGEIVEIGPADALIQTPKHPYTQALVSAVPRGAFSNNQKKNKIVLKGDVPTASSPPSGCRFHTRCIFAKDQCSQEIPTSKEIEPGHFASCHFVLGA